MIWLRLQLSLPNRSVLTQPEYEDSFDRLARLHMLLQILKYRSRLLLSHIQLEGYQLSAVTYSQILRQPSAIDPIAISRTKLDLQVALALLSLPIELRVSITVARPLIDSHSA